MWIPILLQQGPFDELLNSLGKFLPLIVFIGFALVPALKQARAKKEREQTRRRSLERTWERVETEMEAAPEQEPEPGPGDLEERVRRYFEKVGGEQPATQAVERTAPLAPPAPARAPLSGGHGSLVEIDHLDVNLKHLDVKLTGLRHTPRKRLPSRMKAVRGGVSSRRRRRRKEPGAAPADSRPTVRSLLSSRRTLKQAIVLREVLGPPKALEDQKS